MKKMWTRMLAALLCALCLFVPAAVAEEAEEGVLGVGLASFWPFVNAQNEDIASPLGIDEFLFAFVNPKVEAGEGLLEIRWVADDSVIAAVDVRELVFEKVIGDVLGNGQEIEYVEATLRLDEPLSAPGEMYLCLPAGAFVADGKPSNAYGSPETLKTVILDCGFGPGEYVWELEVGQSTEVPLVLGSAARVEVTTEGAVTADVTELTADGVVVVTAAEAGEGSLLVAFFDAEGNEITNGMASYACE